MYLWFVGIFFFGFVTVARPTFALWWPYLLVTSPVATIGLAWALHAMFASLTSRVISYGRAGAVAAAGLAPVQVGEGLITLRQYGNDGTVALGAFAVAASLSLVLARVLSVPKAAAHATEVPPA